MLRWPDGTLAGGVREVADERPHSTALAFEGEAISYAETVEAADRLAAGLAGLGVGPGDRIAVWLANRPEWVFAQLAASRLGAAVVAVNTRYRREELAHLLADSGAAVLVCERSFLGTDHLSMVAELAPELRRAEPGSFESERFPELSAVVAVGGTDPDVPGVRSYEAVVEGRGDRRDVRPETDPEAPVSIFYTSGTTGDPKGCVHSNRSTLNHAYNVGGHLGLCAEDVGLGVLPFEGVMGHNFVTSCLVRGLELVVPTHFDPERAAELIRERGVTYVSGTAQMLLRTIGSDAWSDGHARTLRRGAVFFANGFDADEFRAIEAALGFPVVQPYGLSEANSQVFVGDPEAPRAQRERVGGPTVHEDAEVRVVDPETGDPVEPGEQGELCLRGYNVMEGYLGRPAATAEAIDGDGWLHTGDLGSYDDEGYYFHARLDDAIRVRGFLVSPGEIERAVADHPDVELAQVVGAPHPRHGQVPVAFVKAASARDVTEAAVIDFLEGRIADYKLPEAVVAVSEFPRTEGPHGAKIQKHLLRERVEDRFIG